MSDAIKQRIQEDVKNAMRSQDKQRLTALRLITAAFKQVEVDERIDIDDVRALTILAKMVKQRLDSLSQYKAAGRQDLVDQEQFELDLIHTYLPAQLTEAELKTMVEAAIQAVAAKSLQDMGKVMALLKPKIQGRADLGMVGTLIKEQLV